MMKTKDNQKNLRDVEYVPGAALDIPDSFPDSIDAENAPASDAPSSKITINLTKAVALTLIAAGLWFGSTRIYRTLTIDLNPKLSDAVTFAYGNQLRRVGVRQIDPNGKRVPVDCDFYSFKPCTNLMATIDVTHAGDTYSRAFGRDWNHTKLPFSVSVGVDGTASVYYEPTARRGFDEVKAVIEKIVRDAISVAEAENRRIDEETARQSNNNRSWR